MAEGQLGINTNAVSPGVFLKTSTGTLVKAGPVHVGGTAPNATPASGGAVGNTIGEQWLDNSGTKTILKVWDGSTWVTAVQLEDSISSTSITSAATPNSVKSAYDLAGAALARTGGTMTGDITFSGTQTFPGTLSSGGGTVTGNITLDNQADLRFGEATANGTNWVAFQGAANIAANITWTLPATDAGVAGYALVSDGAGTLSWAAAGGGFDIATTPPVSPTAGDTYWDSDEGTAYIYYDDGVDSQWVPLVPATPPKNATGGGTDEVFFENMQTVTTNYTLTTGRNAVSAGPVSINSGVTVTVPSGASWVVV